MAQVIVVGAGGIGLTSAVALREAGIDAYILAREPPGETTSSVAAGLWYPYLARPRPRVTAWAARTAEVLRELARVPGTGVRMRNGVELRREPGLTRWLVDEGRPAPGAAGGAPRGRGARGRGRRALLRPRRRGRDAVLRVRGGGRGLVAQALG